MAQKVFKGFQQVLEGQFTAETGYIYFVRNEANTDKTDGYLQFNGRKYGTSADAISSLEELIGEIPSGFSSISEWIESNELVTAGALTNLDERVSANTADIAAISGVTGDFATKTELGALSGRVDTLSGAVSANTEFITNSAATKEEVGALSGRVDDIEEDITALTADVEALSAVSADSRISALEAISGESHTHDNKSVLDGISAEDVTAWDNAEANASAYTDSKYDSAVTASQVVLSALTGESATAGYLKSYKIFQGGNEVGLIDIPKDLVVTSGEVVTVSDIKYLRLYIANDPEHPVDIAVSDLAHVYTEGSGITIGNDDKISAKVVDANGLYVDGDGIKVRLATADSAGTISAADFSKLSSIEASAQTNVIEEIKVDGTALIVTDKAVDIVLSGYATNETVGTLSGRVDTLSGAVSANTEFITNSAATKEEVGTLSGRVDALSAISADSRISALEAISGDSHTHANKDVLDTITSADTESWDAALQNIVSGDSSVTVSAKANGVQTISVNISSASNNALELDETNGGLFAAIYYDGDDSDVS